MRIRIVRPSVGILEGVSLSQFSPGSIYDVAPSLAAHLITSGVAVSASIASPTATDDADALDAIDGAIFNGGISISRPEPRGTAADRPTARRSRRIPRP